MLGAVWEFCKVFVNRKILVVAAHPDDEVLGCGGSIARWSSEGHEVHVLLLADGESARGTVLEEDILRRRQDAHTACALLGCKYVYFSNFPDNQMDTVPRLEIIKCIEKLIGDIQPDMVVTHNPSDVNLDHRLVNDAVIVACRPQPGFPVSTLLFFEIPSSTEWRPSGSMNYFQPNLFVEISDFLNKKMEALQVYGSELRAYPHPRSIEAINALCKWRGASVGVAAAEAFILARQIV